MTAERFALALGMTESGGDPRAFGDGGCALTSFQVHPAWVWDQTRTPDVMPKVAETWQSWVESLVRRFYIRNSPQLNDVEIAMRFHLGHTSREGDPDWDAEYAQRFTAYAIRLGA